MNESVNCCSCTIKILALANSLLALEVLILFHIRQRLPIAPMSKIDIAVQNKTCSIQSELSGKHAFENGDNIVYHTHIYFSFIKVRKRKYRNLIGTLVLSK